MSEKNIYRNMPEGKERILVNGHRTGCASAVIVDQLMSCAEIAAILPQNTKITGAGQTGDGWSWFIQTEDFHIGSDCPRRDFLCCGGIFVSLVAFDLIECSPHPSPGVQLTFDLEMELARHAKRKNYAMTERQMHLLKMHTA